MRRSSISIPSNIAEGAARRSPTRFVQFLRIAQAPHAELDTQLELCARLGYLTEEEKYPLEPKMLEVDKTLSGLIYSARRNPILQLPSNSLLFTPYS